ncbi:MAG: hypothetical protein WBN55_00670 [Eudoraea sp.]|uniref:hypothetical protein n=1 Tax=Eudoraea sp. TaxID=1979955 RepID=UPI003C70A0D0
MRERTLVMKFISTSALRKFGPVVFLFICTSIGYCQAETKNIYKTELTVKKRTVLERFDSDLVISPEERIKMKIERVAAIQERLQIMDTLDISDKQRRRLLKELYRSPFSDEWNKVIADLEFEEITH